MLFDAIEFSPLIASGDVLYDLAFLLMDLVERGLTPAANIVFNRYLVETRRAPISMRSPALPLFLSVRAAIRAKVTAARVEHAPARSRSTIRKAARQYFDFARRFVAPPSPQLIAVGGLSGTGKSLLARALAPEIAPAPGAVVLRSDVERKPLFGSDEHAKLPPDAYTPAVTVRVYAGIVDKARRAVAAGHSAIVDAVFAAPQERVASSSRRAVLGVPFRGLFLTADLATRRRASVRAAATPPTPMRPWSRARKSYDLGALDWLRVDASGTPEETLDRTRLASPAKSEMMLDARKFAVATAGFCAFLTLYSPQALLPALAHEFGIGAATISTIMTASTLAIALDRAVHRRDRRRAGAQARDHRRDARGGACRWPARRWRRTCRR